MRIFAEMPSFLKVGLFTERLAFALIAPLPSVLGFSVCVLGVSVYQRMKGYGISPVPATLLSAASAGLALSSPSPEGVAAGLVFAARMLGVMLAAGFLGGAIDANDCIYVCRRLRVPPGGQDVALGVYAVMDAFPRVAGEVLSVQRSRGFFQVRRLVRGETVFAIAVPYVIGILRATQAMWVSLKIRPASVVLLRERRVRVTDLAIVAFALAFWLV